LEDVSKARIDSKELKVKKRRTPHRSFVMGFGVAKGVRRELHEL
jgi:hypothetical protein